VENYISNRRRVISILDIFTTGRIYYLYFGRALYFPNVRNYSTLKANRNE